MSFAQTVALGALAGFTIFLGLPVGRLQLLSSRTRVALAMFSVGVLAFIFVDVMSNGLSIVDDALTAFKDDRGTLGYVVWLVVLLAVYCAGLGVPFLITGLAFGTVTSALTVVRRHYAVVISTGGLVLIGMGILIWTGEFTQLNITVNHWLQTLGLPDLNSDT